MYLILCDGYGGIEKKFYTNARIFYLYMNGSTTVSANI